jgi:hypothetical protein
MKRVILAIGVILIATIAFTSCKKCITCTAYEKTTNIQVDQDHLCGMSIEVNSWVDNYKTDWDYGATYAECEKD